MPFSSMHTTVTSSVPVVHLQACTEMGPSIPDISGMVLANAHVEISNIVPSMLNQGLPKNVLKKEAGNAPKSTLLKSIPELKEERIEKILESLSLEGIESWSEQKQQSAKSLIREYQHLFALTLNELGKTSLVQHDIKLDDEIPFKKGY